MSNHQANIGQQAQEKKPRKTSSILKLLWRIIRFVDIVTRWLDKLEGDE
ncbi:MULTISPECIES: hypothetical protein [Providencia]|nr:MULTISPECIES: hypothetical protein [Providencia]MDH2377231.1 hypothetical protein [Providencia rettgeri]QLI99263.1 hypothetical protein H0A34_20730 [Providencia rettgeri]SPZ22537.1 Uncharacterised protein [Providencia rettgeri]